MKLHIYIETGISRERRNKKQYTNEWYFVRDFLRHLCPDIKEEEDFEIIDVGGKDKLAMFDNQMREATRNNEKNLVIFDCDFVATGGGLENRRKNFEDMKRSLGVDFDYFLFPNNHDEGAFEDMLLHIINPAHKGIMDCFVRYEQCMAKRNEEMGGACYNLPNVKAKIYTYITSFKRSNKETENVKGGEWDFMNTEYWDLDNEYLAPLKAVLESYF